MNDEQEVFVSRHGRRTKLDDADLTGMNIDDQPAVKATTVDEAAAVKPTKPRREMPKLARPKMPRVSIGKKTWIMSGAVVVALVLLPLAALEAVALQYNASADGLSKEVTRVGKDIALPEQKKSALADDAISKTLDALSSARDKACRGGLLDNLANVYPRSKEALKRCTTANGHVSTLINELSVLKQMHAYGKTTEAAIKPALAASDSPYAVIPDQLATWQSVEGKLKSINPPTQLSNFHASLKQVVSDIAAQWGALNNANNSQDSAAFREAEAKLGSFYESLRELSPTLVEAQLRAQAQVNDSLSRI